MLTENDRALSAVIFCIRIYLVIMVTFLYNPFRAMQYIVQMPRFFPVTTPLSETNATEGSDEI